MTPLADALREMFPKGFDHPDTWSCDNQMARRIAHAARADAEREVALRGLTDRLALYLSESVERPFWPAGTREAFVEFLALPRHNGADYVFARRNILAALAKESR